MKARMPSLSGDSLLQSIRDLFKLVDDPRDPSRIRIALSDFLMAGFAIFSLKFPSLLNFEQKMRERGLESNLSPVYGMIEVPSDTHLRSVLDEVNPESLAPVFKKLFTKAQESKRLEEFQFMLGKYLLSIDGTQCYCSNKISCESCLSKKTSTDGVEGVMYFHQMLAGCIVHPERKTVIPLCPEPMQRQDGADKNDSEQPALKRFLNRLRQDHPKLPLILTTDALHSTGPLIRDLRMHSINYILAVKPGSHEKLFEGMDRWTAEGKVKYFTKEEIIGDKVKKKRVHHFRYANRILFNHANIDIGVNFFEYWETTTWVGKRGRSEQIKRHFSWITDFDINEQNIMQLMRGGRARWKIENETFNTLKNQGYDLEHNFGHGYKNLSVVFAYLMFLAFLFDQLQEIGCKQFKTALKDQKRKIYLWEFLRGLFISSYAMKLSFKSWTDFLDHAIGPPGRYSSS